MKSQHKTRHLGLTNFQIAALVLLALADVGLVVILIRLLGINIEMLLTYYLIALFPLLFILSRGARINSVIKRGIPVWREDLPNDMDDSLRYMRQDMDNDHGFIRVDGNLRLVYVRHRTICGYVAYVDLGAQSPKIEYRAGLGEVLFLIPFLIAFSLVIAPAMALNHFLEIDAIRDFIVNSVKWRE